MSAEPAGRRALPPAAILARWTLRRVGKPFGLHLLTTWTLLVFVAVQLDALIDLQTASRVLRGWHPVRVGAVYAALTLVTALGERRRVRAFLLDPGLGILRRQPVPDAAWSPTVALILVGLASPVMAVALLVYGPIGALAMPLWGLAATPALLAAASAGFSRRVLVVPAALGGGALVAVGHLADPVAWALGGAALVGARWLGRGYRAIAARPGDTTWAAPWRPRSRLGALVQRDLLAFGRTERGAVIAALVATAPTGAIAWGLETNGGLRGGALARGIVVLLALLAPLGSASLAKLAVRLGRQLDPPAWPVQPWLRALSMTLATSAFSVPAWLAATLAAPTLGIVGHLRIAAFVTTAAAGGVWIVTATRRTPRIGLHPWWILGAVGLTWPDAGLIVAPFVAAGAILASARALEKERRRVS